MAIHPAFSLTQRYVHEPIQDLSKPWMFCNCIKPVYSRIIGITASIFAAIDLLFHTWSLMVKSGAYLLHSLGFKKIPAPLYAGRLSWHIQQIGRALAGVVFGSLIGLFSPRNLSLIYGETWEKLSATAKNIAEGDAHEENLYDQLTESLSPRNCKDEKSVILKTSSNLYVQLKKLNNDFNLLYFFKNSREGFDGAFSAFLDQLAKLFVTQEEDIKQKGSPINEEILSLEKRIWNLLTPEQKERYRSEQGSKEEKIREHLKTFMV